MRDGSESTDALRHAVGWALLASHAVVWLFLVETRLLASITAGNEPYCWPFFERCWQYRLPHYGSAQMVLLGYLSGILLAGAALRLKRLHTFRVLLLLVNVGLFGVMSLDYRLRANEFYMLFWTQGVYLTTTANIRWTVPLAIVSCYFWAGTLKLNYEWLSGAVLYRPLWGIPAGWTSVACAYVVFLELIAVWGLLARRRSWLLLSLAQLALFHLQSLSQIHWFYPALMATILAWFVIDRVIGPQEGRATLPMLVAGRAPRAAYGVLITFAALQMVPYLYKGDSTLTGQGRILALHMFEARQQCEVNATPDTATRGMPIDLRSGGLAPRMVCDPIVYFNRAQNLCRIQRQRNEAYDFHLTMRSKRSTDSAFTTVIDQPAFCSGRYDYVILGNNRWMHAARSQD